MKNKMFLRKFGPAVFMKADTLGIEPQCSPAGFEAAVITIHESLAGTGQQEAFRTFSQTSCGVFNGEKKSFGLYKGPESRMAWATQ